MAMQFQKAQRTNRKLRLSLIAPSGSGKTASALRIAKALCPDGKRVRFIDTENNSGQLYAGEDFGDGPLDFDHLNLSSFHPDRYVEALKAAAEDGLTGVCIIDSASHAWMGKDGVLDIKDNAARTMRGVNDYTAWRFASPLHAKFVDAMVQAPFHLIVCMRAKTEYALTKDEKTGKNVVEKLGMAAEQRQGLEYEFDVVADLNLQHDLVISKTRCRGLDGKVFNKAGPEVARVLMSWLASGDAPDPVQAPSNVVQLNAGPPVESAREVECTGHVVPDVESRRCSKCDAVLTHSAVALMLVREADSKAALEVALSYILSNKSQLNGDLDTVRAAYAAKATQLS